MAKKKKKEPKKPVDPEVKPLDEGKPPPPIIPPQK